MATINQAPKKAKHSPVVLFKTNNGNSRIDMAYRRHRHITGRSSLDHRCRKRALVASCWSLWVVRCSRHEHRRCANTVMSRCRICKSRQVSTAGEYDGNKMTFNSRKPQGWLIRATSKWLFSIKNRKYVTQPMPLPNGLNLSLDAGDVQQCFSNIYQWI